VCSGVVSRRLRGGMSKAVFPIRFFWPTATAVFLQLCCESGCKQVESVVVLGNGGLTSLSRAAGRSRNLFPEMQLLASHSDQRATRWGAGLGAQIPFRKRGQI
jgi:hypothetical protein